MPAPNTTVTFYNIPALINGKRYPLAKTRAAMDGFFDGITDKKTVKNCSFIRESGLQSISLPGKKSDYAKYNYMRINNDTLDPRNIYAFKGAVEYVNNNTVEVGFDVDEWTTNFQTIDMYDSIMEREHPNQEEREQENDNPYRNDIPKLLTPEPLAYDPTNIEHTLAGGLKFFPKPFTDDDGHEMTDEIICLVTPIIDGTTLQNDFNYFASIFDFVSCPFAANGDPNLLYWCMTYETFTSNRTNLEPEELYGLPGISIFRKAIQLLDSYEAEYLGIVRVPRWVIEQWRTDPTFSKQINVEVINTGLQYTYSDAPAVRNDPTGELYPVIQVPTSNTIHNKKLLRFPYTHIRAMTPDGEIKEYRFEEFVDVEQGTDGAKFAIIGVPGATPSSILAPLHYKFYSYARPLDGGYRYGLNMAERLEYKTYPQMSSLTDNMAIYLASKYAANAETRTWETQYEIKDTLSDINRQTAIDTTAAVVGLAAAPFTGGITALGAVGSIGNAAGGIVNSSITKGRIERDEAMRADIQRSSAKRSAGAPPASGWQYSQTAHGGYGYNPGPNSDMIDAFPAAKNHYTFQVVQPKEALLAEYDKWLDMYGYATSERKKPNVWNYISGATLGLPVFVSVDNLMQTYVKTSDLIVSGSASAAETYIKNMFDRGVFFVKVD